MCVTGLVKKYAKGDVSVHDSLKKKWVEADWGYIDPMVYHSRVKYLTPIGLLRCQPGRLWQTQRNMFPPVKYCDLKRVALVTLLAADRGSSLAISQLTERVYVSGRSC
jgi:hypothetical protein